MSLAGKRVLVVDTNAASRQVIRELLTYWKCEAEEATSSEEALGKIKDPIRRPFDAVIIDLKPSDPDADGNDGEVIRVSGEDLGELVRLDARHGNTPIVLLIPLSKTVLSKDWESRGFVGRVSKPVKQGELGACLASALRIDPASGAGPRRAVANSTPISAQHRLLVVEDNPVNRQVAVGILELLGYSADTAADGASALGALRQTAYTLVLTDCQMPEMDGYELARRIRDPQTKVLNPRIPIIAVTAHSLAGDRELCLAAGMNDYVSKPIRPDLLNEALTRCIGTKPLELNAPELNAPQLDAPDKSQFDADDLIERLMGNHALAKRVAGAFMDSMPQELQALSNAITNSDADGLTLAAHSIKGAAANVGSKAVSDLASQLERLGRAGAIASASEVLPELNARFESLKPAIQQFCRAS